MALILEAGNSENRKAPRNMVGWPVASAPGIAEKAQPDGYCTAPTVI
jgi:hypothetical protein